MIQTRNLILKIGLPDFQAEQPSNYLLNFYFHRNTEISDRTTDNNELEESSVTSALLKRKRELIEASRQ